MKRTYLVLGLLLGLCGLAMAQTKAAGGSTTVSQLLVSARYVYVTTYDGPPESPDVRWEDREAAANVQDEIQRWNHWAVAYRPDQAELVLVVMRRGNEDALWVYQAGHSDGAAMWWQSQRDGLAPKTLPILKDLETQIDAAKVKAANK